MDYNKARESVLLYAETCEVDAGGLMESVRMNAADFTALGELQLAGYLSYGRVYSKLLPLSPGNRRYTHWVQLTESGWALAHEFRRRRALHKGPYAQSVFANRG